MPGYIVDKLQDAIDGTLTGTTVAVLGLSFKAGTSDIRRSPGVAIANKLVHAGATVHSYDPEAMEEAAPDLQPEVKQYESLRDAVKGVDVVMITTEWPEFLNFEASEYKALMKGNILFDAVNQYNALAASSAGLSYFGVGHKV